MIKLEKIGDDLKELPPNYKGSCPNCGEKNVTYMHDLRCDICDNSTVVYCPGCGEHFKVIP